MEPHTFEIEEAIYRRRYLKHWGEKTAVCKFGNLTFELIVDVVLNNWWLILMCDQTLYSSKMFHRVEFVKLYIHTYIRH